MRSRGKTLLPKVVVAARRSGAVVLRLPDGVVSVLSDTVTKDSRAVKSLKALGPVSRRIVSSLVVTSSAALSLLGVMAAAAAMRPMSAMAAEAPVKEVLESHIGWEVDLTTKANVCTVASGHKCQPGKRSEEPNGLAVPNGVAVNNDPTSSHYHDVYVIDQAHRVQELTASGEFVSMFDGEVDMRTKARSARPHCTTSVSSAEKTLRGPCCLRPWSIVDCLASRTAHT